MSSAPTTDRGGIQQTIRALLASGHTLSFVYDGEDKVQVSTQGQAVEAIMAVDDARLYVLLPNDKTGWVRFVMGNSPEEVVCDYTVNLCPTLDPLTEGWQE